MLMPPPPQEAVELDYTNYRGERRPRTVYLHSLWYGKTEWHPEEQWFMRAFDLEKDDYRDFALKDLHAWRRV